MKHLITARLIELELVALIHSAVRLATKLKGMSPGPRRLGERKQLSPELAAQGSCAQRQKRAASPARWLLVVLTDMRKVGKQDLIH